MKTLIIALTAAAFSLTALPNASQAGAKKHRYAEKPYAGTRHGSRFSRRDFDRLPIRITRPPNTAHYTFQDYAHWAARAFQPTRRR